MYILLEAKEKDFSFIFASVELLLMINNKMKLMKWLNDNLSAVGYSRHASGSRMANGRKESAERARWTNKLMGRYGS